MQLRILHPAHGFADVVGQQSLDMAVEGILGTEWQHVVGIADADRAMSIEPLALIAGQEPPHARIAHVFLVQVAVIVKVLAEDKVHGLIKLLLDIRAVLIDAKVVIRRTDARHRIGIIHIKIIRCTGDKTIDFAIFQQTVGFFPRRRQLKDIHRQAMLCHPIPKNL